MRTRTLLVASVLLLAVAGAGAILTETASIPAAQQVGNETDGGTATVDEPTAGGTTTDGPATGTTTDGPVAGTTEGGSGTESEPGTPTPAPDQEPDPGDGAAVGSDGTPDTPASTGTTASGTPGATSTGTDASEPAVPRSTGDPNETVPAGVSWEYDVPITDAWVHWWLSHEGVFGVQFTGNGDEPVMRVYHGGGPPDVPEHTPSGMEVQLVLTDAMPFYGPPPEGYAWEPMANRTYSYELEISDHAAREVLSDDPVRGVRADLYGGVTFFVVDEEYAETAPREIEGHDVDYVVVEPASNPSG